MKEMQEMLAWGDPYFLPWSSQTHRDRWLPGPGRKEELLFNGYRVPVWVDEKILEMDGGTNPGCTIV